MYTIECQVITDRCMNVELYIKKSYYLMLVLPKSALGGEIWIRYKPSEKFPEVV